MPEYKLTSVTPHMLLAQKHLEGQKPTTPIKVLFTDRDDTINDDGPGYLHQYEQMEIFPQAYQVLRQKQLEGYFIVIVTNQSGISKNKFSEQDFIQCMNDMARDAYQTTGLVIDAVLYAKTSDDSEPWRKPNPQTFIEFSQYFNVDRSKSYMMGDKTIDILYGKNLGLTTIAVRTGTEICQEADYVIDSIAGLEQIPFK